MDAEYFKNNISDELDGATCYVKRAIEIKAMSPDWAKMFLDMSAAELGHATKLWKMFEQYHKILEEKYKTVPECIEKLYDEAAEEYAERSAKVKYMHEMYNK